MIEILGEIPLYDIHNLELKVIGAAIEEAAKIVGISKTHIILHDNYGKSYGVDLNQETTIEAFTTNFNKMGYCLAHKHYIMEYEFKLYLDDKHKDDLGPDGRLIAQRLNDETLRCTYDQPGGSASVKLFRIVREHFDKAFSDSPTHLDSNRA